MTTWKVESFFVVNLWALYFKYVSKLLLVNKQFKLEYVHSILSDLNYVVWDVLVHDILSCHVFSDHAPIHLSFLLCLLWQSSHCHSFTDWYLNIERLSQYDELMWLYSCLGWSLHIYICIIILYNYIKN